MELLEKVGLKPWAYALPTTLSGGMRQRVSLVRALLDDPPVILMDEPFSQLDAITRNELQTLSFTLMQERTVIMVTHDPHEAHRLSHQIHVLQSGTPTRSQVLVPECDPVRELAQQSSTKNMSQLWQLLGHGQDNSMHVAPNNDADSHTVRA